MAGLTFSFCPDRDSEIRLRTHPTVFTKTIATALSRMSPRRPGLFRTGYSYGVTVGDYNNDGFEDLFITYWGQNLLYRNNGDGTFTDVTKEAGLLDAQARFGSGCAFVDYDRDGNLDLFVSNYLVFD